MKDILVYFVCVLHISTKVSASNATVFAFVNDTRTNGVLDIQEYGSFVARFVFNDDNLPAVLDSCKVSSHPDTGEMRSGLTLSEDGHTVHVPSVTRNDTSLTCWLLGNGNSSLTSTIRFNVLFAPSCSLVVIKNRKGMEFYKCHCHVNPPPRYYWFAINRKVIYNYTGNVISRERFSPGAKNVTCSANNGIHENENIAAMILPEENESRRWARAIVGTVLTVFYSIVGFFIFFRYWKQKTRKPKYSEAKTTEI